jgi:hypothetical protein
MPIHPKLVVNGNFSNVASLRASFNQFILVRLPALDLGGACRRNTRLRLYA